MAKKKYTGILAEPLKPDEDDEEIHWQRAIALYEHYGIDPDETLADFQLAMALARDHVPGFRYRQFRRPRPSTAERDVMLIIRMVSRLKRGLSVNRAAEVVVEKHPELGFNSAAAARVRFDQLSNPKRPDRGGARANMIALFNSTLPEDEKL